MKRIVLAAALLFGGVNLVAQELPAPSPSATLQQRIGLTDFTVDYSRPSAKDRAIFGELVPYNQMWRTGANRNTMVEFNTTVNIAGKDVKAGKYSLFTIPNDGKWTIMLNSGIEHWGTNGYDEKAEVLRAEIPSKNTDFHETFTIEFDNLRTESATMVLSWEKTKVEIPIKVKSTDMALKNIDKAIAESKEEDKWKVYRNAANFYLNNNLDIKKAHEYMTSSLKLNQNSWYSYWLNAEVLAEMKEYQDAVKSAKMAIKVGEKEAANHEGEFGYTDMIKGGIEKWEKM